MKNIRQRIRQRAGDRCEYCHSHQDYILGWLEVDHIKPRILGGSNTLENLCLACELCNQYKRAQTHSIDYQSGQHVPLFNPRLQDWSEHFTWSDDGLEIIGLSPEGRATVFALRMNNELAITVRKNWVKAGWHPPSTKI
jgi:hypothetical protein